MIFTIVPYIFPLLISLILTSCGKTQQPENEPSSVVVETQQQTHQKIVLEEKITFLKINYNCQLSATLPSQNKSCSPLTYPEISKQLTAVQETLRYAQRYQLVSDSILNSWQIIEKNIEKQRQLVQTWLNQTASRRTELNSQIADRDLAHRRTLTPGEGLDYEIKSVTVRQNIEQVVRLSSRLNKLNHLKELETLYTTAPSPGLSDQAEEKQLSLQFEKSLSENQIEVTRTFGEEWANLKKEIKTLWLPHLQIEIDPSLDQAFPLLIWSSTNQLNQTIKQVDDAFIRLENIAQALQSANSLVVDKTIDRFILTYDENYFPLKAKSYQYAPGSELGFTYRYSFRNTARDLLTFLNSFDQKNSNPRWSKRQQLIRERVKLIEQLPLEINTRNQIAVLIKTNPRLLSLENTDFSLITIEEQIKRIENLPQVLNDLIEKRRKNNPRDLLKKVYLQIGSQFKCAYDPRKQSDLYLSTPTLSRADLERCLIRREYN